METTEKGLIWFATTKKFTKLVSKVNFTGLDFKILFHLLNEMDYNNKVQDFYNKELAKTFKKSEQSTSTSVSKLRKNNIIKRTKQPYEIMINPEYFYNGTNSIRKNKTIEYSKL